jgi:uncharacterized protein
MLTSIQAQYHNLCTQNHVDVSHGLQHATRVAAHIKEAIQCSPRSFSPDRILAMELAALLHDADDRKYFDTENYENARRIMCDCGIPSKVATEATYMIDLVSGAKNGNHIPVECVEEPELLWPRWADRIESIGHIGIVRCWQYNVEKNRLVSSEDTPRPRSHEEALSFVTSERFETYQRLGTSASMLDHYYDKLLHVKSITPDMVQNSYLELALSERIFPMLDICVLYGEKGETAVIEEIKKLCQNEV